jgi:hypothetical protein
LCHPNRVGGAALVVTLVTFFVGGGTRRRHGRGRGTGAATTTAVLRGSGANVHRRRQQQRVTCCTGAAVTNGIPNPTSTATTSTATTGSEGVVGFTGWVEGAWHLAVILGLFDNVYFQLVCAYNFRGVSTTGEFSASLQRTSLASSARPYNVTAQLLKTPYLNRNRLRTTDRHEVAKRLVECGHARWPDALLDRVGLHWDPRVAQGCHIFVSVRNQRDHKTPCCHSNHMHVV